MLNFWALSAIAAFGLGEVVSMNGQFRGAPPGGSVPVLDFPQIQIGDDKIRIYTRYHCIRVNDVPLCPGEDRIVPKRDLIVESGYPVNSKSVQFWKPKWSDSWHIPEGLNSHNKGAHVFVGSDYCLYNADVLTQYNVFKIACAKDCYDGPETENPWSSARYGNDSPDYSDPISGLEDRNALRSKQPCAKSSGKKTSFNPEEGADMGSSAAFPVAAEAADEYHDEPGTNENTPLAWTGLPDGVFNRFNIEDSAAVADAGNFGEVFDKRMKRSVSRQQRRQARQILG